MNDNPTCQWRTSSYSGPNGNCVEVAIGAAETRVRDSKDRATAPQRYSRTAWRAFTRQLIRP